MMNNIHYILEDGEIKSVDLLTWARWLESADRKVAFTTVNGCDVSTVFLGIDHNFWGGEPLLFETMVFRGELDQEYERYSTLEQAMQGHERMAARVKALNPDSP